MRTHTPPAAQRGMTTLGLLILLLFVGIFIYAGVRLVPVYLEDLKISGTFSQLEQQFSEGAESKAAILKVIRNRFDVESVRAVSAKDVKIRRVGSGYEVSIAYTNRQPFLANIDFAVDFSHSVLLER